jgi:hypothetical protein
MALFTSTIGPCEKGPNNLSAILYYSGSKKKKVPIKGVYLVRKNVSVLWQHLHVSTYKGLKWRK